MEGTAQVLLITCVQVSHDNDPTCTIPGLVPGLKLKQLNRIQPSLISLFSYNDMPKCFLKKAYQG